MRRFASSAGSIAIDVLSSEIAIAYCSFLIASIALLYRIDHVSWRAASSGVAVRSGSPAPMRGGGCCADAAAAAARSTTIARGKVAWRATAELDDLANR